MAFSQFKTLGTHPTPLFNAFDENRNFLLKKVQENKKQFNFYLHIHIFRDILTWIYIYGT